MQTLFTGAAIEPHLPVPDGIDWTITVIYLGLAFGLAVLGYVCMVLDVRAHLRSLRRASSSSPVIASNFPIGPVKIHRVASWPSV